MVFPQLISPPAPARDLEMLVLMWMSPLWVVGERIALTVIMRASFKGRRRRTSPQSPAAIRRLWEKSNKAL